MPIVNAEAAFNKYFHDYLGVTPNGRMEAQGPDTSVKAKDRETWCKQRTPQEQFELDVAFWYGTMCTFSGHSEKRLMVQRIFATLYFGGLIYKRHKIWYPWWHSGIPIAAALSHGGRIVIQTPIDDDRDADSFWNWLWAGMSPDANGRQAATHDAKYRKAPEKVLHTLKYWNEVSTKTSGKTASHYGVNIPCGGQGNINPISGNKIVDDGEHAHLYLGRVAATADRQGFIMIGCEDSAPMDRYTGTHRAWAKIKGGVPMPYYGKFAYGQTGHAHTWGASGHYSCTGGTKWSKLGTGIGGNDAMFVDLASGWDHVRSGEFYADFLGTDGHKYVFGLAIPTLDQWKKLSKLGMLHKRNDTVKSIDTAIQRYGGSQNFAGAREILNLCKQYLADPKRDKDRDKAINSLKHCAEAIAYG